MSAPDAVPGTSPQSSPYAPASAHAPPRPGEAAPAFALPDTLGGVTRLYDFRQRQPVLLAFVSHPHTPAVREWLSTLARRRARLDELGVAALVVARVSIPALRVLATELDLPFRLLCDADGAVAARYAVRDELLTLFALNRYGYLLQAWHAADTNALPTVDAALDSIDLAEMEDCGCGLPAWPRELLESEDE